CQVDDSSANLFF
nr:immunoglobulin light chain junction region [Macaca mulatta]